MSHWVTSKGPQEAEHRATQQMKAEDAKPERTWSLLTTCVQPCLGLFSGTGGRPIAGMEA